MPHTATLRLTTFACLLLVAGGGTAAFLEARPYFSGGVLAEERFQALAVGRLAPGPSIASQQLILDSCVHAITSVYGRTQPRNSREAVYTRCLVIADGIAASAPSFSYAHFVGALAASRLGDTAALNERLVRSQQTGPIEQWIAEQRVDLAEDHFSGLSQEALELHEADLRLLVASHRGSMSIARRYVRDTGFRERIVPLVEMMSSEQQQRFVRSVAAAAGPAAAR